MRASELPHRILVEQLLSVQDQVTGEITQAWVDYVKVWAKVTPFSNKDRLSAQAVGVLSKMRCIVRYSTLTQAITSDMRVLWRGKYYRIEGDPYADNIKGVDWLTINLATGEKTWQE